MGRCSITTVDPLRGVRDGQEPLRTIAATRQWRGKGVFGWNAVVRTPGRVSLGEAVECVQPREALEPIGPPLAG